MKPIQILFLLLAVTFSFNSAATLPTDSVIVDNLDITYLEDMVKKKIDSIRVSYKLNALHNDTMLHKIAIDHAIYLQNRKEMSHYQSSSLKRTALDRAKYYGIKNLQMIGENIVYNFLERIKLYDPNTDEINYHFSYTYERLANDLVTTWMESKSHYETLKTPQWDATAVAISYDPGTKEIIGVQIFADYRWK